MKLKPSKVSIVFLSFFLALVFGIINHSSLCFAGSDPTPRVSANIPLDSIIYTYLDKLEGLGYLDVMMPGRKPYNRYQVAKWVRMINEKAASKGDLPPYARTILTELLKEFEQELAVLDGVHQENGIKLKEMTFNGVHYEGPSLTQKKIKSHYQPLNINNNGYKLGEDFNGIMAIRVEGDLTDHLLFSLTPRLSYDRAEDFSAGLESGYVKTHLQNLQIQLGKDAMWWGEGERGSLTLTNNMTPFTMLQLSTLEPIRFDGLLKFLRTMDVNAFYTGLEKKRDDVNGPSFVGFRSDFDPVPGFTFGLALTAMVGGEGHELHFDDLWDFILGNNAQSAAEDKWNTIAGWDWRWKVPFLNGIQVYEEYYGEDQGDATIPEPIGIAHIYGIYLPRLTPDGEWDLRLEVAKTSKIWYSHSLYTDGYTYKDNLIGDAMGNNAKRYYLKLSHFFANGSWMGFHGERVLMDQTATNPQTVNSFWVSYGAPLKAGWNLEATAGKAYLDNCNYRADQPEVNFLLGIRFRKAF